MKLLALCLFVGTVVAQQETLTSLTPPERVFCYYIFRASLPGNELLYDQHHRHAGVIGAILETILLRKEMIQYADETFPDEFFDQLKLYLTSFWANHGQYSVALPGANKFTPSLLQLDAVTPQRVQKGLQLLGDDSAEEHISLIYRSLFDASYEPTLVTPGSIEQSAINLYTPGMTDADYETLSLPDRERLTAYFILAYDFRGKQVGIKPYSLVGHYHEPFKVALYWLSKAQQHVQKIPEVFDTSVAKSLELLCAYLVTGKEEYLLESQSHAADSTSRVKYAWGFEQSELDPKKTRGLFEASISVATEDIFVIGDTWVPCTTCRGANPTLYPIFEPVLDSENREIVDARVVWPNDIFEQQRYWGRLAGSTE